MRMETANSPNPDGRNQRPIRIAIVGGGLVGTTAALALTRLPNVSVKLYERSPGPREVGAWIAMTPSGLRILERLLSNFSELDRIIYHGPTGISNRHWKTGEAMVAVPSLHVAPHLREGRTHRVPLHNILLSEVPPGTIEYGKEVTGMEIQQHNKQKTVHLKFTDGQEIEADMLVAADGIYSRLRQHYLPNSVPAYRGAVAYRTIFSEDLVKHIRNLPNDTSAWWANHGEIVYLSRVGLGKYGIVLIVREDPEYAQSLRWARGLGLSGIERLRKHVANWDPIIDQVLRSIPGIDSYPLESAPWMENMTRDGAVAFVGDAAHPTAGAYGAGSTFGFGDAWALYRSLLNYYDAGQANAAFHGYDIKRALTLFLRVRRPFLERVEKQFLFDKSNATYIAAAETEDQWKGRWKQKFSLRWWMMEHDVEAEWQRLAEEFNFYDQQTATSKL